jgi:tetratricopeptide (TPR) repeat protein
MIIAIRLRLAKTENLMPELPDKLYQRIVSLCERGDALAEQEDYDDALQRYEEAWSLLPEPRSDWEAASWIQAAIGDAYFFTGDFVSGAEAFRTALNSIEAHQNPFLHLRLGQCEYEMGNSPKAGDELIRAYMLGGDEVFEDEDPKYFAFLKTVADPPEGGW